MNFPSLTTIARALAAALACAIAGASLAQTQSAPVANSAPERTTATYGDWVLRCERAATATPAAHVCEVAQSIQVQGQQGPIAQLAIGRLQKSDPLKLTVVLPNNVLLTTAPKVFAEEKDGQAVELPWHRCLPGGCFAETAPNEDVLKRLRARTEPGRLEFKDGAGRDMRVPFSNRGLSLALDALVKE